MGAKFQKRKAFGQHFLRDVAVIQKIIQRFMELCGRSPNATVLEIGPGEGALTFPLMEQAAFKGRTFKLAERDRDLIHRWSGTPGITTMIEGDFLDHSVDKIKDLGEFLVISNLPYSAGTAILVRLIEHRQQIPEMVLMFQAEVARRLYAPPSTPDRGSLSLHVQNFYDVERVLLVKPNAFQPPPKVNSEVVHLTRRSEPMIPFKNDQDEGRFRDLLKTAFMHRRKMLRGNFSGSRWQKAFEKSGVDPTLRAESLDWSQWRAIWDAGLLLLLALLSHNADASVFEGATASPTAVHRLLNQKTPFVVEFGITYSQPNLKSMTNVVVENERTSSISGTRYGDVNAQYPDVFVQTVFAEFLVDPKSRFTLGVRTSLPLNGIAQLDTGAIYLPEYVLYRQNQQRPEIFVFSGFDVSSDVRLGLGIDVGFSVNAEANIFLQSGSGRYSDQRLVARMKPYFVPVLGVDIELWKIWLRGENKSKLDLTTSAGARVFGSLQAGIDFSYLSSSTLFYQPWLLELAREISLSETTRILPSISYQWWSGFQAPAAVILNDVSNNCNGQAGCEATFRPGIQPSYRAKNLWVPALGLEERFGDDTWFEAGYRYRDSIFDATPSGVGNYLDPPRHDVLAGMRFLQKSGWEWGFRLMGSYLVTQTVVKSDSTEIGASQNVATGYQAGGIVYGGSLSLAIPFQAGGKDEVRKP